MIVTAGGLDMHVPGAWWVLKVPSEPLLPIQLAGVIGSRYYMHACIYIYIHVIVPIAHQPFVGVWSALCWCLISSKNQIKLEIGENSAGLQYLNCLRDLQLRVCCYNLLYANCFYHILDADAERIQMNAEGLSLVLGPETLRCTGSAHSRLMMPLPLDSPPCMVEAALPWDQHLVVAKKIWM